MATASPGETQDLAAALARELPADTVLALHGDLGVGKTTWVQGLARGLGITTAVTSPTFNLFTVHRGTHHRLLHLDAYRLEGEAQVEALMLEDFLVSPWVAAIEWPERIAGWLPPDTWHLELSIQPNEQHHVRLR